jgi:Domain of unknown function (DUF4390)
VSFRTHLVALLLLLPLAAAPLRASTADFLVSSAWVNVRNGVFEMNASIDYPLEERVQTALDAGVSVHFDLRCVVETKGRYWFDDTLVDVVLRRELAWNALTQSYVLREVDSREQRSFATLAEAMAAAGEIVGWPVVVEPQLDPDETYRIRVRASYRRGSLARLRGLLPWFDGWNRETEWHSWTLPR